MSNSNQIVALALSFANRGQQIDEREDALVLVGVFADASEHNSAVSLSRSTPAAFSSVTVYDREIGGHVLDDDEFDPARVVVINALKPIVSGVAAFVFTTAAARSLERATPPRLLICWELEERAAFSCRGLKVAHWQLDQLIEVPAASVAINPRKFVKDFVPEREIVDDLSPWMLTEPPAITSAIYDVWRRQAARRLLGGLVNNVHLDDGAVWLQANGPPLFRILATDAKLESALHHIALAIDWVYLRGNDIDVRHSILAVELARACRSEGPFSDAVCQAIDSAGTTYEAHVQSSSRETIKALADLRKTVIEETQKVTLRAQDLASGLWRDIAVSCAPFIIRLFSDPSKQTDRLLSAALYFGAAIIIVASFRLQVGINQRYLINQKNSRQKWLETLYPIISPVERKRIAEDPIKQAENDYEETKHVVGLYYIFLVLFLCLFGLGNLFGAMSPPSPLQAQTSFTQ